MKIRSVRQNNRKRVFEVRTSTKSLVFPFSTADPSPTTKDPVHELSVDDEAGREAFTYMLASGRAGTVHIDQVLEYNQDPSYLRDLLLYRLTIEAQKRIAASPLSKRRSSVDWEHRRRSCTGFSISRTTPSLSIKCWPCFRC